MTTDKAEAGGDVTGFTVLIGEREFRFELWPPGELAELPEIPFYKEFPDLYATLVATAFALPPEVIKDGTRSG